MQGGITLIEVLVVISILALVMMLATPMVSGVTAANLRAASESVAGAIRYMFNVSAMTGAYCRLQLDLQGTAYRAECADRPFYLSKTLETATNEGEREEKDDEEDEKRLSSDEEEMAERQKLKPNFRELKTTLMKKAALPDGVRFDGIWTSHQRDRFTKGQGHLYFFPGGFTEKAYIHIVDEKGAAYTLIVNQLTGKVTVEPRYVEAPEK
jgi:general secretion pathway protein H